MKSCVVVLAALFLFSGCTAQNVGNLTLELASVIYRHGDRSPTGTFPNDEYTESDWPQGYGQLSLTGMSQQHFLGEILRNRYVREAKLINGSYTRYQVYVRSTDVDRTLMSAQAQLSGLFPPNADQQFNPTVAWQPIPVHTTDSKQDLLLNAHNNCPTYRQLREADPMTTEYQQFEKDNQEFFDYLAVHSGFEEVNLTIAENLQDVLFVENVTADKEAPSWLTPENLTQLNNVKDFFERLLVNSMEKRRLAAGPWLQKVLWDMKGKANGTLDKEKLFLYSAHDATVAIMMSALGVWDGKQPPYATAFFVELYSDQNENYFVKLFYRKNPDSDVIEQLNATSTLSLKDFENIVAPLIPSDWEEECGISTPDPSTITYPSTSTEESSYCRRTTIIFSIASTFTGLGLVLLMVLLAMILYYTFRQSRYRRLTNDAKVDSVKT